MFLGVGTGAYVAGIFHLVTHAFFKALLFLGSGSVIHAMHHAYHATHSHEDAQDMRNMGGLRQYMPWYLGADVDRDARHRRASRRSPASSPRTRSWPRRSPRGGARAVFYLFWAMGSLAALLTAFYMARLMAMTFLGPEPDRRGGAGGTCTRRPGS